MSEDGDRLQALVDRAARAHLDAHGRLPVAVHVHPETPGAGEIEGYTVILDPNCEPGAAFVR